MTTYLCACGNFKTGAPHRSSATKKWVCSGRPECTGVAAVIVTSTRRIQIRMSQEFKAHVAKWQTQRT